MTEPTAGHLAWMNEFGAAPETPGEQELYVIYRLGFDAGTSAGWDLRGKKTIEYLQGKA